MVPLREAALNMQFGSKRGYIVYAGAGFGGGGAVW